MQTIAPAAFAQKLDAARRADTQAAHALAQALIHVKPIDAEMHELFLTRPEGYAETLHKIADIVASLPLLRANAKVMADYRALLERRACHRCNGTGTYSGASNATRRGHAYCFYCNGTGDSGRL